MAKFLRAFSALLSFGLMLVLTGCQKVIMLDPKGAIAADEKELFLTALFLMLLIVVPVIFLTLFIARKYRASNTKAKYAPNWGHSTILEMIWWSIPCIIIVILAAYTLVSTRALDPYKPLDSKAKPVIIEVVALNWRWLFIYPEQHIATINYVQFPINTPVTFLITSDAPMNSFQIPQLAGQIYAMPGMQTKLHLISNTVGDYAGFSANLSGEGFADMKFVAHVSSQADFNNWVNTVKKSNKNLTMASYNKLALDSKDEHVQYFSSVTKDLFKNVIMKYMMPPMTDNKT